MFALDWELVNAVLVGVGGVLGLHNDVRLLTRLFCKGLAQDSLTAFVLLSLLVDVVESLLAWLLEEGLIFVFSSDSSLLLSLNLPLRLLLQLVVQWNVQILLPNTELLLQQ